MPSRAMDDLLRLSVLLVVLLDPLTAAIGAAVLASSRPSAARVMLVVGGSVVAVAVLAAVALVADPLLDALDISAEAAQLAAGLVVLVPAIDLLWQGPEGRVRRSDDAGWLRLALFPYGVPLLAGPASAAAVIAWAAWEGTGVTVGASAVATALTAVIVLGWRRPPTGRVARALGGFTAVLIALIAFDLIRDGVLST
jgi:multiple antibiotic resistance protein